MDGAEIFPDVLGEAFSFSSQRLAQLASLVTAGATVEARRRAQKSAAEAGRGEQAVRALRERERAERELARAGWAPAHDAGWLREADLLETARAWCAGVTCADDDPVAVSAVRKCEERQRALHPFAMARYDRLRSEGAGAFEAMREAVPLFGLAPHARPGDQGTERPGLAASGTVDTASWDGGAGGSPELGPEPDRGDRVEQRGWEIVRELQAHAEAERGHPLSPDELATTLGAMTTLPGEVIDRLARGGVEDYVVDEAGHEVTRDPVGVSASHREADQDGGRGTVTDGHVVVDRTAAQLARESFPCTVTDAVMATTTAGTQEGRSSARTTQSPGIVMRRPL